MTLGLRSILILVAALAALTACGPGAGGDRPPPTNSATISGRLSGPAGADLTAVTVTACPVQGAGCRTATAAAADGSFTLTGLATVAHDVTAWADLDGDGRVGAGDLHGTARVVPPAASVDLAVRFVPPTGGGGGGLEGGIVKGRLTNTNGQPISGATVIADNTLFYNTNVIGKSGADGRYRLDVSRPLGTWQVTASVSLPFDGRTFTAELTPADPSPFAGSEGAVRDFTLTLEDLSGPALIQTAVGDYTPYEEIEVTLTPVGPIVDGSPGATIVSTLEPTGDGWAVRGVPIGVYTITARHLPSDERMLVSRRLTVTQDYEWGPSYTTGFTSPGLNIYRLEAEVRRDE